jgi:RimJ/RimL family protein N-acetyltransferase
LQLRALDDADVEDIHYLYSDQDVARYLMRLPSPYSRGAAQRFVADAQADLARGAAYVLEIVQRDIGVFVGVVALRIPSHDPALTDEERAEENGLGILGYSITPPFWNRGFATEAGRRMIAFAFDELGLVRLQATAPRANAASRRVLDRLGFAIEETGIWEEPLYEGPAHLADRYVLDRGRYI